MKKILILGHKLHGTTTVADYLRDNYGVTFLDSSYAACKLFIYEELKYEYGYATIDECFKDRRSSDEMRALWYNLITKYNEEDPTKLARHMLESSDMYVGMRSEKEVKACVEKRVFDYIIGVYDYRKVLEPKTSMSIDMEKYCDVVIMNNSDLPELYRKIDKIAKGLQIPLYKRFYASLRKFFKEFKVEFSLSLTYKTEKSY